MNKKQISILILILVILILSGAVDFYFWNTHKQNKLINQQNEELKNSSIKTSILGNYSLDEAVTEFLLSKQQFNWKTEEGSTNFCVFQNLNPESELFPIYIWIRCGEFKVVSQELKEFSGTSLPIKINYPNELSHYDIAKFSFDAPRDGSFYDKDVKIIFPENIWPRLIFDSTSLNQRILEVARESLLNH
jgi:hypothetical protein